MFALMSLRLEAAWLADLNELACGNKQEALLVVFKTCESSVRDTMAQMNNHQLGKEC